MTAESRYLAALAEEIAAACVASTFPRAILLTGSAARGDADAWSDVDLLVFHDVLPSDEALADARARLGVTDVEQEDARASGDVGEHIVLRGVLCQVTHTTIASYEEYLAEVLDRHVARSGTQRALEGILDGRALHGAELIDRWKARAAAYPEPLARAMVEAYLRFFPLWGFPHLVATRDMDLWVAQTLVESGQNVLGVLAGLNRAYYTPLQLKRQHRFAASLRMAPPDLARRLDRLLDPDGAAAIGEQRRLVEEMVRLVEQEMPDAVTAAVRRSLAKHERPWRMPDAAVSGPQ